MLSVAQIRRACRGKLVGVGTGTDAQISSVAIDSRRVNPGGLFVAIKGDRFDGHRFVAQAEAAGARAVLVSRPVRTRAATVVQVKDTVRALGQIAALHRQAFSGKIIAVTGSAGKTSTRRVVAAVLSQKYRVLQSARSENNWIGVPLTLLKLNADYEVAVVEAGTNQPGDMAWLARLIQPDIVIFTNTGEAHLAGLKSRQGVYREKLQLATKGARPPEVIVYNVDDDCLSRLPEEGLSAELKSYSIRCASACRAREVAVNGAGRTAFRVGGQSYCLPLPGRHHVYNALAAISCARLCRVPRESVQHALRRAVPDDNRGRLIKTAAGVLVLNDSYNANPLSFRCALEGLADFKSVRRRIVVAGDMLELGAESRRLHIRLGEDMVAAGIDAVLSVGRHTPQTVRAFGQARPGASALHCRSLAGLHQRLGRLLRKGDLVLVKGSRSMRMERTVAYIIKKFS